MTMRAFYKDITDFIGFKMEVEKEDSAEND